MTRHRRGLQIIAVVALAFLVAVAPAAAKTNTAVASAHTTDTDFNAADTLDNVTVDGNGQAASVTLSQADITLLEDFESGSLDANWSGSTADWSVTTDQAHEGSNSLNSTGTGGDVTFDTPDRAYDNISHWTYEPSGEDASRPLWQWKDSSGTIGIQMRLNGANLQYYDGTSYVDTGIDWPNDEWIELEIDNIDYANNEFDVNVYNANGNLVGSATNLAFRSSTSEIAEIKFFNGEVYYTDNIHYGTGQSRPRQGIYISQTHNAENVTIGWTNLTLTNASATVTWQYNQSGTWTTAATNTFTTTANHTLDVSGNPSRTEWRVNVTLTNQTTNGAPTAQLHDEGLQFTNAFPELNNSTASPDNTKITTSTTTLSIDLTDKTFPLAQGDTVTGECFVEDPDATSFTSVDTDTISQNGTLECTADTTEGGSYRWRINVTDSYGGTDNSSIFTFETPSNITFRNESNGSEVITGVSVTTTFYSADGTTVIERTDSNQDGNISLSGLPVGKEFVVVMEADGWYTRRAYIESIFVQQNLFLLNSTAYPGVNTTFTYEDRTGDFPGDSTTLRVQRAIDINNDSTFEWTTVAGDFWGAANEFPFTGQLNARYRLIVENNAGEQRNLGTHIPTEDGTKNVIVGELSWASLNGTAVAFDAVLNDDDSILASYNDPTKNTTEIRIRVWELGNESNVIADQNYTNGPFGSLDANVTTLTAAETNNTWVVNATATQNDGTLVYHQTTVGGSPFGLPVDPWLLGTLSMIFLTFAASLYGPRTARLGAWTIVILAGILSLFGWVAIPASAIIVAGFIAAGGTIYKEAIPG